MMKKVVLCLIAVACTSGVLAAEVSEDQAMEKARTFLAQQLSGTRRAAANLTLHPAPTGIRQLHAFNADDGGFVIVSASDRTESVLGFSTTGRLDGTMPPAMLALMQSLGDQIADVEQGDAGDGQDLPEGFLSVRASVDPLIPSKWGQEYPYNNLTPTAENNEGKTVHCPTGCVATAMAMVMKYYEWPQGPTAALPATAQQAALPAVTFDWSSMTDTYSRQSPKAACDAVATLMQYCGSAIKMNYDWDLSMSDTAPCAFGLIRYFGYDSETILMTRRPFVTEWEWQDRIYQELADKRPVICGGDGHEFIIDGYKSGDYFHINWGFDGDKDAYFQLSIAENYSTKKKAVEYFPYDMLTGVQPTKKPYTQEEVLKTLGLILTDDTPLELQRTGDSDFPEVKVRMTVKNYTSEVRTNTFDSGLGLFDKDGKLLKVSVASTGNELKHDAWLEDQRVGMAFGQGLPDGLYTLTPVSRVTGSSEWLSNDDVRSIYIIADIRGGKLTLSVRPRDFQLKVNSINFSGSMTTGSEVTAVANVTNRSAYDFDAILILAADRSGKLDGAKTLRQQFQPIPAGKTVDVTFKFTVNEPDTYQACLVYDIFMLGERVPMTIAAAEAKGSDDVALEKDVELKNTRLIEQTDETKHFELEGRELSGFVTVKNPSAANAYEGACEINLMVSSVTADGREENELAENLFKGTVALAPGESRQIPVAYNQLEPDRTYSLTAFCSYNNDLANDPTFVSMTLKTTYGITAYKADRSFVSYAKTDHFTVPEDALAVELDHTGVTKVTPNANPNCLYFIDDSMAKPEGLENSNVIVYSNSEFIAETLTLADGYGFMAPYEFTAKSVSYRRVFTEAEQNSYTTMVLPFDVEKCEAGGEPCTLELLQFGGDMAGKAYFSPVQGMPQFGQPYLVRLNTATSQKDAVVFSAKDQVICDTITALAAGRYEMKGTYVKEQYTQRESFSFADGKGGSVIPLTTAGTPFRAVIQAIGMPTNYEWLAIDATTLTAIDAPRYTPADSAQPYYNLNGQRVDMPRQGVYIRNGRKVVMK